MSSFGCNVVPVVSLSGIVSTFWKVALNLFVDYHCTFMFYLPLTDTRVIQLGQS